MITTTLAVLAALVPALGWTLVHFLWQGALVAAGLSVVLRACRTAKGRHDACFMALVLMAVLPVATFLVLKGEIRMEFVPAGSANSHHAHGFTWEQATVTGWLMGVLALGVRTLGGLILIERLRRKASPLPALWAARCQALQQRMGGSLRVVLTQSNAVAAPLVAGWLKPMVLIPAAALTHLPTDQLEALILHELAHVRRLDAFANLLQAVLETALFYHPAVWWVSRRLRIEREHCCDDLAVAVTRDPAVFVRALQAMEALRPAPWGILAANGGMLKSRAARLLGRAEPARPALSRGAAVMVLGLGALAMTAGIQVQAEPTPGAKPGLEVALTAPAPAPQPAESAPVAESSARFRTVVQVPAPAPVKDPPPSASDTTPSAVLDEAARRDQQLGLLFRARDMLGPAPSDADPIGQATWRGRDYAIAAELDQLLLAKRKARIEEARRGIPVAANTPAEQTRRLRQLEVLDGLIRNIDLTTLHAKAVDEASAANAAVIAAQTPLAMAEARGKAADAQHAVAVLDRAIGDEFELDGARLNDPEQPELRTFMSIAQQPDIPQPDGLESIGDTLSGVAIAQRAGRPVRAADYLEDALRDAETRGAAAEARTRRINPGAARGKVSEEAFRTLAERVRLESVALGVIKEEVAAGRRPAADLRAATASLAAAQAAAYDAIARASRPNTAERQVLHQRSLAEAASYRSHIQRLEAKQSGLPAADRAEVDKALKRLRYEVELNERMAVEVLKPSWGHAPPRDAVQLPSAETGSQLSIRG